jgi:hypothetical protein
MGSIGVFALYKVTSQNHTNSAFRLGQSTDVQNSKSNPFWVPVSDGCPPVALTYWDLQNHPLVTDPKEGTQLHAYYVSENEARTKQYIRNPNSTFYHMTLLFGSCEGAGTRADIRFKLKGANGVGAEHTLPASEFAFNRCGATMLTFEEIEDLGELKGLEICPLDEGKDAEFFLDMAAITRFGANQDSWTFQFNKWVKKCPANQGSDDSSPKKDLFPRIRYLSLKNSGGFALKLHVYTGPDQLHMSSKDIELVGSYALGKTKTADLTKFADKIKDGYVVRLNASVVWGKDNPAKEYFIVDKTSNKKACYEITGATRNNTLHYKGLENYS